MKQKYIMQLIITVFFVLPAKADNTNASQNDESTLHGDFKVAHYWAYYGQYSNNTEILGDAISRLSDLTSKIFKVSQTDVYQAFKLDIIAQGGPQFILSTVAAERVMMGLKLGLTEDVSTFINSAHSLNPQFGASLAVMALGYQGINLKDSVREAALPPLKSDIDQCARSCAVHFLGLQNNRFANDLQLGRAGSFNNYSMSEQEQIQNLFPSQKNQQPGNSYRNNRDNVSAFSQECISSCISDIGVSTAGGFLGGFTLGRPFGPQAATASGIAFGLSAGSLRALKCTGSPTCAKSRQQELNEQERDRLKAENDLREERLRKENLDQKEREAANRKERESADRDRQMKMEEAKRKEAEQQEQKRKQMEERIADSFDRNKNTDERMDSSASCESTKTCDGTMNATVIPDKYRELPAEPKKDIHGNVLTNLDLAGTPILRDPLDNGSTGLNDGHGNLLTRQDLISTPILNSDLATSGPRRSLNGKIITQMDMVGNPGLGYRNNSFIPPQEVGLIQNKLGSN